MKTRACLKIVLTLSLLIPAAADVVECENGDRYNGKVVLLNDRELKLQNDIQGVITIPRDKITTITLKRQTVAGASASRTNGAALFDASSVQKVQQEYLSGANPEANQLFQEMVNGLLSGKLDVEDIRGKAQSTLRELKAHDGELGEDGELLAGYMSILENFLKASPTNVARPSAPAVNKLEPRTGNAP